MSWWKRNKPSPPIVIPPTIPPRGLTMTVSFLDKDGAPVQGTLISGRMGRPDWGVDGVPISWFVLSLTAPVGFAYGQPVSLALKATGHDEIDLEVPFAPEFSVRVEPAAPLARRGTPHVEGRSVVDDDGASFPLGATLLWALAGLMRNEDEHVWRNYAFVRKMEYDYVRAFCHCVGGPWTNLNDDMDFRRPDFKPLLAKLLDVGYNEHGLRTQLTLAGGPPDDARALAQAVYEVVEPRRHTVMALESVNEGNDTEAHAIEMARVLAPLGLPFGVGLGNAGIDTIERASNACGANMAFFHPERTLPGMRQARQCWDFKEMKRARSGNEPPGPQGSGGAQEDPFTLALTRFSALACGDSMWVMHTGHGVFGRTVPYGSGYRYANLEEAPNIQEQMTAVRNADFHIKHLANALPMFSPFNTGNIIGWPDGGSGGSVEKLYGSTDGKNFVITAIGTVGPTRFPVRQACSLKVFNPATKAVLIEQRYNGGEMIEVSGLQGYGFVGVVD